jgi:hypothetical protein
VAAISAVTHAVGADISRTSSALTLQSTTQLGSQAARHRQPLHPEDAYEYYRPREAGPFIVRASPLNATQDQNQSNGVSKVEESIKRIRMIRATVSRACISNLLHLRYRFVMRSNRGSAAGSLRGCGRSRDPVSLP